MLVQIWINEDLIALLFYILSIYTTIFHLQYLFINSIFVNSCVVKFNLLAYLFKNIFIVF